ncbi:hypothetical protein [Yersinia mollaretii]|nr:hypothetical protein [Yersinia mollaretii]QKJ04630.1 hypothetical protein HRD69_17455 [Yersinia mollaretii ATCC 43969]
MSFSVGNLNRVVTTAFKNTTNDSRFHKADMKSLTSMMKEIKNNPTQGPFNRISQSEANSFNQKIDTMISTLNAQGSAMKDEKMASLVGLKTALTKITTQSESKKTEFSSKLDDKKIKKDDLMSSLGNGTQRGFGINLNVTSNRQDLM